MKVLNWKKILLATLAFCLIVVSAISNAQTGAEEGKDERIRVLLNGKALEFDVDPQIKEDRVLVPMRVIFEAMGTEVFWIDSTREIHAKIDDEIVVAMQIDQKVMLVRGVKIDLDVPPQIIDGRTLVPVRAIVEGLNSKVEWDGENREVIIYKDDEDKLETNPLPSASPTPMPMPSQTPTTSSTPKPTQTSAPPPTYDTDSNISNKVGDVEYGYVKLPPDWSLAKDVPHVSKDIAYIGFVNNEDFTIVLGNLGEETVMPELSDYSNVELAGFDAYRCTTYFAEDDSYLFEWYFYDDNASDEIRTLRYISVRGPSDGIMGVVSLITTTFSLA